MSRVETIIQRARDTLADPEKTRWSDEKLVRYANDAQSDIVRRAKLLRKKITMAIKEHIPLYQLPDDFLLLDRVAVQGENALTLLSQSELIQKKDYWEDDEGKKILGVVYDKYNRGYIRLYPIPIEQYESRAEMNSPYGITTYISNGTMNSVYGIATDMTTFNTEVEFTSRYGVLTDDAATNLLIIYYIRKPIPITSISQDPEIDETFDRAMKHYVVGNALRDDMDTQNRATGAEELALFEKEIREALKDDATDFTRNNSQYRTNYRGAFDRGSYGL